ncbi:unnamed protein product [Paramecium sonneborni]|uniref:Transmembrane protein n=1 Tax=Paramecium sonneborni TaxID=65129 RepID=A0A8S1QXL1_9CILI|nr:unnamed protein product [Paramecium sonneborni]
MRISKKEQMIQKIESILRRSFWKPTLKQEQILSVFYWNIIYDVGFSIYFYIFINLIQNLKFLILYPDTNQIYYKDSKPQFFNKVSLSRTLNFFKPIYFFFILNNQQGW